MLRMLNEMIRTKNICRYRNINPNLLSYAVGLCTGFTFGGNGLGSTFLAGSGGV